MPDFKKLADDVFDYMVAVRRTIHRRPSITDEEGETRDYIATELEKMGIPFRTDGVNNILATIKGNGSRRIALRADIDALPMNEDTGLSFRSEKPGAMHACGHDFHIANLLGVAKALSDITEELSGTVFLCFQAGEEQSKHALSLLSMLKEEGGADSCFSMHVTPGEETGVIEYRHGPIMAGCSLFSVEIEGRGGHGSMPWMSKDPLKPAAEMLLRLAALPAIRFSAFDPVVINPCAIEGGTAGNIVPQSAVIRGNIRYFRNELYDKIVDAMREVVENVADSYGVTAKLAMAAEQAPAMVNDDAAVDRLKSVLEKQGIPSVELSEPWMASDNYSEFLRKYGGTYCFGGVTKKGTTPYPIHNPKFNPDEAALKTFCEMFLAYTFAFFDERIK